MVSLDSRGHAFAVNHMGRPYKIADSGSNSTAAALERGRAAKKYAVQSLERAVEEATKRSINGVDNLQVKYFPRGGGGRIVQGLTVKRPVRAGETLLSVPARWILRSSSAKTSAYLEQVLDNSSLLKTALASTSHQLRLAAALLTLRDLAGSEWGWYLDGLPSLAEKRNERLDLANREILSSFNDLSLVQHTLDLQANRSKRLAQFRRMGGKASDEDWTWAEMVLSTRARRSGSELILVPIADIVNSGVEHERNVEAIIGNLSKGELFQLVAKQDIAPGVELLDGHADGDSNFGAQARACEAFGESTKEQRSSSGCGEARVADMERCSRLSWAVTGSSRAGNVSCGARDTDAHEDPFCFLAKLSADHCHEFQPFPCPRDICVTIGFGGAFIADMRRANLERPFLFKFLFLLACALIPARVARLLRMYPWQQHSRHIPLYRASMEPTAWRKMPFEGKVVGMKEAATVRQGSRCGPF